MRRAACFVLLLVSASALRVVGQSSVPQPTFATSPVRSTIALTLPAPQPNPYRAIPDDQYGLSSGRNFTVADINGDGLNDLIVKPTYLNFFPKHPPRFWINVGGGQFEDRTPTMFDGPVPEVAAAASTFIADYNLDGRLDLFFVDSGLEDTHPTDPGFTGGKNTVILSQPDGRLKDTTATSLPINEQTFNHVSSAADIDGNGAMDLFITRLGGPRMPGNGAILMLNDGSGKFIETNRGLPRPVAFLPTAEASAVGMDRQPSGSTGACDLDGDNRADLVTGSYTNNFYPKNIRVFQQSAAGEFTEKHRSAVPDGIVQLAASRPGNLSVGAAGIVCGDLNGDNRRDLVIHWETSTSNSFIEILRNDGNFQFTDVTVSWFGSYDSRYTGRNNSLRPIGAIELRDLNSDGILDLTPKAGVSWTPDLLWAGGFAFLNDGSGRLQPMRYRPNSPTGTAADFNRILGCMGNTCAFGVIVADVTGDGRVDLMLIDTESMKSRDLPNREDRVIVYTFPGAP